MPYTPKDATPATVTANRDAGARYDMAGRQDFTAAARGLIAPWPGPVSSADGGHVVFDPAWFDFIDDDAPAPGTVEPSLWRQSQVMRRGGLYKVTDGCTRRATTTSPT
jgi:alkyl sulfatase BDS1-like metallo-beta-lactamase superfamily hydrolase